MRLFPRRVWFRSEIANQSDRPLFIIVLILFALVALLISRAAAAVHPVPLDPKVDAAKCLECHEDKTKGKAVHSAIAMGCLSCHEIRVNKDVTRVKLITTTPYGALPHLPRRQEGRRHQGHGSSSGGARLPEMPRSAYIGQQEPTAEADVGEKRKISASPATHRA